MSEIDLSALAAPFRSTQVSWRVGATTRDKQKGLALAYIDARDVYERLDSACGVAGWQCRHADGGDGRLSCEIGIKVDGEWIWKSDGAGGRQASGGVKGLSEQDANKGDYSDALKRAAVAWGVGRYLYDLPAEWVPLKTREVNGKLYVNGFADGVEGQLIGYHEKYIEGMRASADPVAPPPKSKRDARADYAALQQEIDACGTDLDLIDATVTSEAFLRAAERLPEDWRAGLRERVQQARSEAKAAQSPMPDMSREFA